MSPAGSLIVGAIVLVPASLAADRSWTLHPLSCSLPARAASAFIIYFRLVQTLGSFGTTGRRPVCACRSASAWRCSGNLGRHRRGSGSCAPLPAWPR